MKRDDAYPLISHFAQFLDRPEKERLVAQVAWVASRQQKRAFAVWLPTTQRKKPGFKKAQSN